jgi:hypothetical protein
MTVSTDSSTRLDELQADTDATMAGEGKEAR